MKTTYSGLRHLQGIEAYKMYWEQFYQCRPRLSSIRAIDENLEIIIDSNGLLLAYRHDPPEDMKWMVVNAGRWQLHDEKNQTPEVIAVVKLMLSGLRNIFSLS